jgi:uncharacterized damage-inducible protein DinB
MNLPEYLHQLFDYSYWANKRYLAVAEGLTEEQLFRQHGHSWGDVYGILLHMLSSEAVWLKRWNGIFPKSHLSRDEFPTLVALRANWQKLQIDMRDFVKAQTDENLLALKTYTNFSGITYRVPLWQMLMHVVNHETHHRGELSAMFVLMNVPHPEEEVIQYFLDLSGQKKA